MVVAIGASAGGHEPLEQIFTRLTTDTGLAFVVLMHLTADSPSHLVDLLRHYTTMPVVTAEEAMAVQPDTVYAIPPGKVLSIRGGLLHLLPTAGGAGPHHPIDLFFTALAEDQGESAVAVILSGFGNDGSQGVRRIKECGGMVLVQEPHTAINGSMPEQAIDSGAVDLILPAEAMAAQLQEIANGWPGAANLLGRDTLHSEELQLMFTLLKAKTGHDFSAYKRNTVLRRIDRRMMVNEVQQFRNYLTILEEDPKEAEALYQELLIGVTGFFRDPEAFQLLRSEVIPRLFASRAEDEPVRIWHACCATGEEAYSVAMLIREHLEERQLQTRVQIFATDLDEAAINQARAGVYTPAIEAEIDQPWLHKYFTRHNGNYQVDKRLREMIVFAHHNIIKDPPFSRLDLLVCRNFLIYLNMEMQRRLMALFHQVLNPGGFLFLGSAETVGLQSNLFAPVDKKWKIFIRQNGEQRLDLPFPFFGPIRRMSGVSTTLRQSESQPPTPTLLAEKILIERYVPARVIVNERNEVVHFSKQAGAYLHTPEGEPTRDVIRLVREELRPALRAAIYKTCTEQRENVFQGIKVNSDSGASLINLIVLPLHSSDQGEKLVLVIFEPAPPQTAPPAIGEPTIIDGANRDAVIHHLEEQLRVTSEQLQATCEQLESSNEGFLLANEELMATNEELQSANEELQATNEELETSKEELQALNEELITVNVELQNKIEELDHSNNDLENLFASAEIATLFLDRSLHIKRFSPAMAALFHLIPADIGRPFRHLSTIADWAGLPADATRVMESSTSMEREVQFPQDGRNSIMRLLPYSNSSNDVDGIVITLIDITQRKQMEMAIKESAATLRLFIEQAPASLAMFDREMRYLQVSRRWLVEYGLGDRDILGMSHYAVFPEISDEWKEAHQRGLEGEILRSEADLFVRADGSHQWVRWEIRPWVDAQDKIGGIVIFSEDITEIKKAEEALRRYELLAAHSRDIILFVDRESGRLLEVNNAACQAYGYSREELHQLTVHDLRGPEAYLLTKEQMAQADSQGILFETTHLRKDGTTFDAEVNSKGAVIGGRRLLLSVVRDISERKQAALISARLASIVTSSEDAIISKDLDGTILSWNTGAERLFGFRADEMIGQSITLLIPAELDHEEHLIQMTLAKGEHLDHFETVRLTKDGGKVAVSLTVSPIHDQQGTVVGISKIARDISERKQAEQALRASEQRLRLALEATSEALWDWDVPSGRVYRSARYYELVNRRREEDTQDFAFFRSTVHPEDIEHALANIEAHQQGLSESIAFEYRLHPQLGETRWLRGKGKVVARDEHGGALRIVGTLADVTREKRITDALRESQSTLQAALFSMTDAVFISDRDGRFVTFNDAFATFHRFADKESCLTSLAQYYDIFEVYLDTGEPLPFEQWAIPRALRGEIATNEEYSLRRKDTGETWAGSYSFSPIRDKQGGIVGAVVVGRDITERKQQEQALQLSEQRRTLALEGASAGTWEWILSSNENIWSDEIWELYGLQPYSCKPSYAAWLNVVHPDERDTVEQDLLAAVERAVPFQLEWRINLPGDAERWLMARGRPSFDSNGTLERYLGIVMDITERKENEASRNRLETQLQQAQKMEAIGTLAGGIAHDFNNILAAILGYTEMAKEGLDSGVDVRRDLGKVLEAAGRAANLVRQILTFSRHNRTERVPLEPIHLVKEAIKLLRPALPSTITIHPIRHEGTGAILADPTQIHQVVMNLCTNAFHAMEATGGVLTISLGDYELRAEDLANHPKIAPGTFVRLSIGDSGPGITPEIMDKIFDPYFTTKEVGRGTGLGLAIVHSIATAAGGFVHCESVPGNGAIFHVYFPAIETELPQKTGPIKTATMGQERILLIDDEVMLAEMERTMLERLGYQVTVSTNSLDALAVFQENPLQFDAVITDQTMPEMTGIDLARKMLAIRPELPIILCTGYSSLINEQQARASGIKGFAMKPLSNKELAQMLRLVLEEPGDKGPAKGGLDKQ
jgi:two-component system CheB/CheR fusion protein